MARWWDDTKEATFDHSRQAFSHSTSARRNSDHFSRLDRSSANAKAHCNWCEAEFHFCAGSFSNHEIAQWKLFRSLFKYVCAQQW
jgi:hypothetical protein